MCDISKTSCPICNRLFPVDQIQTHANKCIFLNCNDEQKRKRSPSPVLPISENSKDKSLVQETPKKSPSSFYVGKIRRTDQDLSKSELNNPTHSNSDQNHDNQNKHSVKSDPNKFKFLVPLAKQVKPKSFNDFFGHQELLGKDTIFRNLLEKGEIPNMILWGPPGCGKTSLAGIVSEICKQNPTKYKYISLSALTSGVKDVQNIFTLAKNDLKFNKRTVLFMDEIHRFNKKQQDTFLESVEKGEIILIGATTENPSFVLNSALLSRCRVVVMEKLKIEDVYAILRNAVDSLAIRIVDDIEDLEEGNKTGNLGIEQAALQILANMSDGDARMALTSLQLAIQNCSSSLTSLITTNDIKETAKKSHMFYDRNGDEHYNIISAMHKSIRGSDANAALYWTTRMIVSGEDPKYIARRLVRAASEDIGNADPMALQLAVSTMQGCHLLGMPECDVLLAQCAIYLARAPKSRQADAALAKVKQVINNHKGPQPAVPIHLRNAPTKLMKDLGYGKVEAGGSYEFMPPELRNVKFLD